MTAHIKRIRIGGKTKAGREFGQALDLNPGLSVLSASNGFGKSLLFSALAWCFGLEDWLGGRNNEPRTVFSNAILSELSDPETGDAYAVESSFAEVKICRHDGEKLRLMRPVVGGNTRRIYFECSYFSGELNARERTMADPNSGFQRKLFEWLGIPLQPVTTRTSEKLSYLYLENIAPYFMVDQKQGWASIASMQVRKYAQNDMSQIPVEYILGVKELIEDRVRQRQLEQRSKTMLWEARALANRVNEVSVRMAGFALTSPSRNKVDHYAKEWENVDFAAIASEKGFDISDRIEELSRVLEASRVAIVQGGAPDNSGERTLERTVAEYQQAKSKHVQLLREVFELSVQIRENKALQDDISIQVETASDLVVFDDVGLAAVGACPTCGQSVTPETFGLTPQVSRAHSMTLDQLKRERKLLREVGARLAEGIEHAKAQVQEVEAQLRTLRQAQSLVVRSKTRSQEELSAAALRLADSERQLDKHRSYKETLKQLSEEAVEWVKEAKKLTPPEPSDDASERISLFEIELRECLLDVAHGGLRSVEGQYIHLDDEYLPRVKGQRMERLGSASDRARLVFAYCTALMLSSINGSHPGFCVFDEPLQQNPDKVKTIASLDFWAELSKKIKGDQQVVIFTHLSDKYNSYLRSKGVTVYSASRPYLLRIERNSESD